MSLQPSPQGSLLFHGPTSMYHKDVSLHNTQKTTSTEPHVGPKLWQSLGVPQNVHIEDGLVNKALSLFFLYQYPQFMFIYREAFLEDYYENAHQGKYWSYPLLYAVCALGLRASPDAKIQEKGDAVYRIAENIILLKALDSPHVTVVQSLLCLAFYELGAGNHSKGWVLAGMAFRMGQDLGFQQDPQFLVSQDSTIASHQDLVIRRRVYYGLYVSDKIISLYLGRPVMLYEEEAAVDLPEALPDFPPLHDWYGLNELTESELGHLGGTVLMPSFEGLIELSKIAEEMLFKVFSTKMVKKPQRDLVLSRSSRLEELSVRLGRWHANLPNHLKWNQWNTTSESLKPHVLILHLLYHSILISLNRHFVRPTSGFAANAGSKETCIASADTIIALIRQFRFQQGLGHSPVLVVYSAVMASSAIFFTQDPTTPTMEKDRRLSFILKALEECSQTHNLAKEACIKLQANIDARNTAIAEKLALETTTSAGVFQQPEYTEAPFMGWVDGTMFDLGAFDLGVSGSLDPMAFRGIGADPSQWLLGSIGSTTEPALVDGSLSNEPWIDFPSTMNNGDYSTTHGYGPQHRDTTEQ
ncbi:hypothetical protein BP6252_14153 [Coleophoma cylindrospora]|uniref:Xylanolytic transcriptional activator regulatory domain-containing protein n=1 Tax=Coleophoma cylindrospora TaxID=1849047 RepID=A0A3D8Q439_9HELO|nr:hypothetical protein BP6252_14153 [Coleophoma cylindrospora]